VPVKRRGAVLAVPVARARAPRRHPPSGSIRSCIHDAVGRPQQAALVGEDEGDAEQVPDESGDAAADPEDEVAGVADDEIGRSGGGGEAVVEHGAEELWIGLGDHRGVPDDALGKGGVLLQVTDHPATKRSSERPDREPNTSAPAHRRLGAWSPRLPTAHGGLSSTHHQLFCFLQYAQAPNAVIHAAENAVAP